MSEIREIDEILRQIRKSLKPEPKKYPPESEKIGLSRRGRKRKHESKAEKQRAYRERKKSRNTVSIS